MKIEQKIVGYSVAKQDKNEEHTSTTPELTVAATSNIVQMTESLKRPDVVTGETYKLKPPEHVSKHALYVTINDVVLNPGTEDEQRRPFEIFINTKSLEHYQWIVALTLVMSAVFRKGGDITFLVDELTSVFDPRGGYWEKGKFVPSMIAEIGTIIKQHLTHIGMMEATELDESTIQLIKEKRAQFDALNKDKTDSSDSSGYPPSATSCSSCGEKAVVVLDGCGCCLACGFSHCS